jgi:hypothetical protein
MYVYVCEAGGVADDGCASPMGSPGRGKLYLQDSARAGDQDVCLTSVLDMGVEFGG